MAIYDHMAEFHGLPISDCEDFLDGGPVDPASLPAPGAVAWRLRVDPFEESAGPPDVPEEWAGWGEWRKRFARFLDAVDPGGVRALVVGEWGEAYETDAGEPIEAIVEARGRLASLRAVFVGDIVMEEAEISWIQQGRVTDLLAAFPALEELGARGGSELRFEEVRHAGLRRLVVETGGMPAGAVRGVAGSEFPALAHLDLWLGTPNYGGDASVDDLAPILSGERLPALRHLALRNSEIQDAVCAAVASAPVVARLDSLDLSMGVLTDEGASALLTGQPLTHLRRLDLSHNYLSEEMRARLRETLEPAGVELTVDAGGAKGDERWRFVAVGE
ncbi:Leucine Rich repeat-containing protein [Streptomyces zhaozhouensis]|uniref:Leucine Rich repeat-containing protein n=1 Tax=Streptomyces zhaozhouensis TaxID=1300267 RepID=A0A286DHN9_9ACTN|nr:STM4015 family protein [Streptomyces zhaozhouensis]SOD58277.1 Leucine Rich repeat-containing protein [Streptomyces zhaozhouensis]